VIHFLIKIHFIMKRIKILLAVTAVVFSVSSYGQGRPSLSIGAELGVPTGDLNLTQKIGVGGTAKLAFPVGGGTAITLQSGIISFSGDEFGTTKLPAYNFIPIKAGVRHQFVPGGFYVEPQLGYTSINNTNSSGSAKGGFTYAANAGYFINNQFDISARYEAVSKSNQTLPFIGMRLAYNFGL
jgi:hypothetical protein